MANSTDPPIKTRLRAHRVLTPAANCSDSRGDESNSGDESAGDEHNNTAAIVKSEERSPELEGSDSEEEEGPAFPKLKGTRRYNYTTGKVERRVRKDHGPPQKHAGQSFKVKPESDEEKPKKKPKKKRALLEDSDDDMDWTPAFEQQQAAKKKQEARKKKAQRESAVHEKLAKERLGRSEVAAGGLSAARLLALPVELLFEIFGHLELRDLVHLSGSCDTLKEALESPSGTALFCKMYDAEKLPKMSEDDDMDEWDMARFLMEKDCQLCDRKGEAEVVDFYLRLRICDKCSVETGKFYSKDDAAKLDLHPLTLQCVPISKNVYPGRDAVTHSRYRKAELLEVSEELYAIEKEDDKAAKKRTKGKKGKSAAAPKNAPKTKKYGKRVKEFVEGCKTVAKTYLKTKNDVKRASKELESGKWERYWEERNLKTTNQEFVKTKAIELGYSKDIINISSVTNSPVVVAPKAFTDADWIIYSSVLLPKLDKAVHDNREKLRKLSLVWHYKQVGYLEASAECPFTIKLEIEDYLDLPSVKRLWKNDTGSLAIIARSDVEDVQDDIFEEIETLREKIRFNTIAHLLIVTEDRDLPVEWTTTCPPKSKQLLSPTVYNEEWFSHFMRKPTCYSSCCETATQANFDQRADAITSLWSIGSRWRSGWDLACHYDEHALKARKMVVELAGMSTSAKEDPSPQLDALGAVFKVRKAPPRNDSYYYSSPPPPSVMGWKALVSYLTDNLYLYDFSTKRRWTLDEIEVTVLR